ncbi:hypothetical protein NJO91_33675 [Streptomyces microflavus]|uniref:hypothetical protein n=1 Tax=Streptomyces microflavus TaxID=1919 RepID=UPI0029A53DDB|nr:hypothetical protein [Streptomyces microflavus]MDX2408065.1 hypothetical protein [Streptomyces microflavus]
MKFGQSAEQVSAALGEPTNGRNLTGQWVQFSSLGVDTYYRSEDRTLAAVAIDACYGPQISFEGVRLVGRLPSELTPWLEAGADTHEGRLCIGLNGEAGLPGLGLVMRCQQNGDFARTRPVMVSPDWAEMSVDSWEGPIPSREWSVY